MSSYITSFTAHSMYKQWIEIMCDWQSVYFILLKIFLNVIFPQILKWFPLKLLISLHTNYYCNEVVVLVKMSSLKVVVLNKIIEYTFKSEVI